MVTRLTEALREFRARYPGQDSSHKRLEGWLLDYAPNDRRAVRALVAVARLGLHLEMQKLGSRADGLAFRRITDAITSREGLASDLAEQAVLAWLEALGVEAPDQAVLRGPLDKGLVAATLDTTRCIHLAVVQADMPLVAQVRVEGVTNRTLSDLTASIWLGGSEVGSTLKSTTWSASIDRLRGRQAVLLDGVDARVAQNALFELRAPIAGRWWIEVRAKDEVLLRAFRDVEVIPPRAWPMGRVPLPALAAFVLRDDPLVAEIVGEAAARVDDADARPAPLRALAALQAVLADMEIACVRDDASVVTGPRSVVAKACGSATELQLLLAACLEHGGMPPLLLWASSGPALGIWTTGERPALTATDDAELVARLVESGALELAPVGDHEVRLRAVDTSVAALDLSAARRAGVLPLDALVLDDGTEPKGAVPNATRQRLLDRAALAATRTGVLLPGAWSMRLARSEGAADATPPRLQQWKRRLLDLTLNNPLLNAKPRVTSLPLLVANVGALEDSLAAGQVFRLDPRPPAPHPGAPLPDVTNAMMDGAVAAGALLVELPERRLVTQSKNALRAFRSALEEGGVHTLFLTLGSLEWCEASRPAELRRAPLLLLPVLIRRSRRGHYEIKKADAETEINAALLEFLRREHGVDVSGVEPLPLDHAGVDVAAVFAAFRRGLAAVPRTATWQVREDAQVAVLAFSGFRMWRDLDHQAADLLRHPLVRRLTLGEADSEPAPPFPEASTLDERWSAGDVLCPLEADGSQLAAILAACDGRSFVLEGPPGTGKSQTIANLIAQCLAAGKTVLFVSQKRAALEVVESRLEALGLGPFLLELHSKKASKPEFIQQLREAAEFRAARPPRDWNAESEQLGAARTELNAIVRAIHRPRDPGMSVYEAIADAESRRASLRLEIGQHVEFDPSRACAAGWFERAKVALADLAPSFARLGEGWEELQAVRATDWPKARRDQVNVELACVAEAAVAMEEASAAVEPWLGALTGASADDFELASVLLTQVASSPRPKLALLQGSGEDIDAWLARLERAHASASTLGERYLPAISEEALEPRIRTMRQWIGVFFLGWLVLLTVRWFFRPFAKSAVVPNTALLADAEAIVALRAERTALAKELTNIVTRLGTFSSDPWGLPTPDVKRAREFVAFAKSFRNRATRFPKALVLAAEDAPPDAEEPIARFRAAYEAWAAAKHAAAATLDFASGFGKPAERGHIRAVAAQAMAIRDRIPKLRDWGAYRRNRDACLALGLGRVVKSLERGEVEPGDLVESFANAWLVWWIDQNVASDKLLSTFDGLKQRSREERFAALDQSQRDLARHEILARIAARQPRVDEGAPPNSQAGILLRQFGRRAGFASPRQLFSECAGLIRQLKPCVLMSPQSVAQYLDPSQPPFDVVVFDEASQVPTHEAIGAIARGKHVVVVGDSKQLPPTSFFLGQAKAEDGASDGDDVVSELDSILEECSASGLPSHRLEWHYRSRHPSLISFSNARYYGSRLQVLPAAQARPETLGVSVALVKGAVYDRGGTATNALEARALVDELVRRLRDPEASRRSHGVVTFSRAQQALVEDLLEDARELHPEIEPHFDAERPEPVIIKNLENIQGDERDVVLFSVGYGPDAKGRMMANMGPLGQLGGERRLNVAITRARQQLVVYVSFEPAALDLSAVSGQGLHDLKAFLESAAAWEDVMVAGDRAEVESRDAALKRALAARLEAAGHAVDLDVGVGRSRIDLAVRDREEPDVYTLGVELDGPRHAATSTARDRDRLRWQVLAGLGWRMHRVRALDWYEDPDATVASLLARIDQKEQGLAEDQSLSPAAIAPIAPAPNGAPNEEVAPASTTRVPYRVARVGERSGEFSWSHREVPGTVAEIVRQEGPIAERLLARRVADAWGMKRTPSGLSGWAARLLAKIPPEQRPVQRDGFFWPPSLDVATWRAYRVPDSNEPATRRDVEDIPVEELANAADDLRARYGAMPREDLARALAKRFGFRGLTRVVAQRVELGIERAEARAQRASTGALGPAPMP
jgi:very-short-patch-repair endonuclease